MDGNVYLIESQHLNKFILSSNGGHIQSNLDDLSLDISKQSIDNQESKDEENYVEIMEIVDPSEESFNEESPNESEKDSKIFVPCVENGHFVILPNHRPQEDAETIYTNVKTEPNILQLNQILESISVEIPTLVRSNASSSIRIMNNNKSISSQSKKTELNSERHQNYNQNMSRKYAKERYSLYSGSNGTLRSNKLKCNSTVDTVKMIPPQIFKRQLMDTSDTIAPPSRLPATRRQLELLDWSVRKIFATPSSTMCSRLSRAFTRNCFTKTEEDSINVQDLGLLPVGYQVPIDRSKIKRITRKRRTTINNNYNKYFHPSIFYPETRLTVLDDPFKNPEESNVQVYVDGDEVEQETCYYISEDTDGDTQQIIFIGEHQDEEQGVVKNNIQVLLAAAAEEQLSPKEIYFCQESVVNNCQDSQDIQTSSDQIIFTFDNNDENEEIILPT